MSPGLSPKYSSGLTGPYGVTRCDSEPCPNRGVPTTDTRPFLRSSIQSRVPTSGCGSSDRGGPEHNVIPDTGQGRRAGVSALGSGTAAAIPRSRRTGNRGTPCGPHKDFTGPLRPSLPFSLPPVGSRISPTLSPLLSPSEPQKGINTKHNFFCLL